MSKLEIKSYNLKYVVKSVKAAGKRPLELKFIQVDL